MGNLTRDPEYRQLPSGQGLCKLGIATNRQYKNRQTGAVVQEVCYIDVDVWGAQAESCRQYLEKGRPVLIEGRLKQETWDDQSGQKRSRHSIVAEQVTFMGSRGGAVIAENSEGIDSRGATFSDAAGISLQDQQKTEEELMQQISQIKKKSATKKPDNSSALASDIAFQDQPPFEDNLPF